MTNYLIIIGPSARIGLADNGVYPGDCHCLPCGPQYELLVEFSSTHLPGRGHRLTLAQTIFDPFRED